MTRAVGMTRATGMTPAGGWRGVVVIILNELRRTGRDRTGLFFVLVLPVVIITVIGATFAAVGEDLPVGVVDLDGSQRSAELVERLDASAALGVRLVDDERELRQLVRVQALTGGLVIPAGYGTAVSAGEDVEVVLLTQQAQGTTAAVLRAAQAVVDEQGQRLAAARFTTEVVGGDLEDNLVLADSMATAQTPLPVELEGTGRDRFAAGNQFSYTAPSNLVLFVFVNSLGVGALFVQARQLGVVDRILSGPATPATVVVGVAANRYLFALIQALLIVMVGAVGFGVVWGDPLGVAALVGMYSAVGAGAGLLVGSLVRNPDQAYAVGIPASIALGMLGGCMWPLEIVSPGMRIAGHLTPHAWAMDAWVKLIFDGEGVGAIGVELAVLGAFATVTLGLASWRVHRQLTG